MNKYISGAISGAIEGALANSTSTKLGFSLATFRSPANDLEKILHEAILGVGHRVIWGLNYHATDYMIAKVLCGIFVPKADGLKIQLIDSVAFSMIDSVVCDLFHTADEIKQDTSFIQEYL